MFIVRPPGIVYEGETDEQAAEIDGKVAAHNKAWQENLDAWRPGKPAKFYEMWCKKFAPHLVEDSHK